MNFAHAQILWLLLIFPPALLAFFWWSWRARQKWMARFIQSRLLPGLVAGVSVTRQKIRASLVIGAVVCLILALARPQWGYDTEEVPQRGLDIVVAIDTSKSMLATDIAPNRLARAKLAALDLMQQAKSDRLGLVAFAGSAFLQCPLTVDEAAFRQSVESLNVNTIPEGGTALAEAIQTAQEAFKEGDNYKVLVLFTDGEDHEPGALEAARKAAKDGLRIFTIGVGTEQGDLLTFIGQNGTREYIRDEQGNVVKSHLNSALLQQIASATSGGFYLPLKGANTMDTLYQRGIASLPQADLGTHEVHRPREQYHWPLAIAIALLIAEMLYPERRTPVRRGSRKRSQRAGQETGAPTVAAVLILFAIAANSQTSPATAMSDFKAGKFKEAQQEFERLAKTNETHSATFLFNAGDAAYRATNYEAALNLFNSAAAATPDLKLQEKAYFNIGNTQFHMGEAAKDLDGVEQLWKEAMKSFQNALALETNDVDAANNLAFVKRNIAAIEELRELARRAKEQADRDVRQRNYHRALEILQQQVQNNIAAKQFKDYVQRLKEIDEIATPAQH